MIAKITRAYVRHYGDNGQTTACVEWIDCRGKMGRTEGPAHVIGDKPGGYGHIVHVGEHMAALMRRGVDGGLTIEEETW